MVMLIWEENAHKCNENSVAMQKTSAENRPNALLMRFNCICLKVYSSVLLTGHSSECPPPENLPNDTLCVDNGQCLKGECIPFCEAVENLQSCACNGKLTC